MEKASFARINWKSLGNICKVKPSHWTWNAESKKSSGVRFIPNPSTTNKIVRVKLTRGRKAKMFRSAKVKPVVVYAPRNSTKISETRDCTVHAFANAAQVPYFAARLALERAGRCTGRGFSLNKGFRSFSGKVAGYRLTSILRNKVTLNEFLAKHPIGRFYVESASHAFAVIHGKVVDNLPRASGNRRIDTALTISVDNKE